MRDSGNLHPCVTMRSRARQISSYVAGQQPQAPPQQPPPDGAAGIDPPPPRPVTATVDSNLTVSAWPRGHAAGAVASAIGRLTSNVSPQARQR